MRLTLQVVVVGVLGHTAVKECPCQVVHSVLLVLHCLGDNLSVEVVMEAVIQVRLHWQWLVQELLEEVLSRKRLKKDCCCCRAKMSNCQNGQKERNN